MGSSALLAFKGVREECSKRLCYTAGAADPHFRSQCPLPPLPQRTKAESQLPLSQDHLGGHRKLPISLMVSFLPIAAQAYPPSGFGPAAHLLWLHSPCTPAEQSESKAPSRMVCRHLSGYCPCLNWKNTVLVRTKDNPVSLGQWKRTGIVSQFRSWT